MENEGEFLGSDNLISTIYRKIIYLLFWLIVDVVLINISIFSAYWLRFDGQVQESIILIYKNSFIFITIIKICIFYYFGLYKSLWRYASIRELFTIGIASIIANSLVMAYIYIMNHPIPRSIFIIACILDIGLIGISRLTYRIFRRYIKERLVSIRNANKKRVLIYGAGDAGAAVLRELKNHKELNSLPVAFIDDNVNKVNTKINGVPVLGTRNNLLNIVKKKKIEEIIIAMPSASRKDIRGIIELCQQSSCNLKILPGVFELINGNVSIKELRDIKIEDLLGRDPVETNIKEISHYLGNKVVLVTGGGGSIGSELCRQIADLNPKQLLVLDIYENHAYELQQELLNSHKNLDLKVLIASVRDKKRLEYIFNKYKPDFVFHAAAHKHVPLMEDNPTEAIKNNVFGTLNVVKCAHQNRTENFVLISTDKAVNPTNIMGATKRTAEMIIQFYSRFAVTKFAAVRFGNVLGSHGSVIPLFRKQIEAGGPVTVTHEEITRYFMTIPEAVQLVIQAGYMSKGGEIFVLDMGEPVKIIDLAKNLIRLSGLKPDDIEIKITGLRPGEKMYEELFMEEENLSKTSHNRIFISKTEFDGYETLQSNLDNLDRLIRNEEENVCEYICNIVTTYKREKETEKVG